MKAEIRTQTHNASPRSIATTIIDQLRQRKSYLNTTEVMTIFGVTRATLCGWVRSGTIGAIRIGKDNKFDPATVAQFLDARQL